MWLKTRTRMLKREFSDARTMRAKLVLAAKYTTMIPTAPAAQAG